MCMSRYAKKKKKKSDYDQLEWGELLRRTKTLHRHQEDLLGGLGSGL